VFDPRQRSIHVPIVRGLPSLLSFRGWQIDTSFGWVERFVALIQPYGFGIRRIMSIMSMRNFNFNVTIIINAARLTVR